MNRRVTKCKSDRLRKLYNANLGSPLKIAFRCGRLHHIITGCWRLCNRPQETFAEIFHKWQHGFSMEQVRIQYEPEVETKKLLM